MRKGSYAWWDENLTSEIYLGTYRPDWWHACREISARLRGASSLIDIGTGDGHTIWQVLGTAAQTYGRVKKVMLVEPNKKALRVARNRVAQLSIETRCFNGTGEEYLVAHTRTRYDVATVLHANYYFGQGSGREVHIQTLSRIVRITRRTLVLTAPETSDYYAALRNNPFGEHVFAERIAESFSSSQFRVEVVDVPMRFYVQHVDHFDGEARLLWRFFNDTRSDPTRETLESFKSQLREVRDDAGYINFRDRLLVVEHR
jgi:hypothetical protein